MKKSFLLATSLLILSSKIFGSDTLRLQSTLNEVTVFFSGAELFAESALNLGPGVHYLIVEDLPASIDPKSIRVNGNTELLIHSVNYEFKDVNLSKNPKVLRMIAEEERLKQTQAELRAELEVFETERKIILENSKLSNGNQSLTANQIKQAADMFRARLLEINQNKSRVSDDIRSIDKGLKKLWKLLHKEYYQKQSRSLELMIKVECSQAYHNKLEFSFYSPLAGWTPEYDIRAASLNTPLELIYKAAVYQSSGLDWKEFQLTLSTENPLQGQEVPQLKPWVLPHREQESRYEKPQAAGKLEGKVWDLNGEPIPFARISLYDNNKLILQQNTGEDGRFSIKPLAYGNYSLVAEHFAYFSQKRRVELNQYEQPLIIHLSNKDDLLLIDKTKSSKVTSAEDIQNMAVRDITSIASSVNGKRRVNIPLMAESASGDISNLQYRVLKPQSIPSDAKDYRINMTSSKVPASYLYEVVPKIDPRVYLRAEIADWEELKLLPGLARLYLRGNYVGQTRIDPSTITDTLNLSLGHDKGINIKRKLGNEVRGDGLFGANVLREMSWEIEVRNLKSEAATIVIKDQIPLSGKEYIKVKVLNLGSAKLDQKTGAIHWRLQLEPQSKQSVQFSYQITYPEEVRISDF